VNPATILALLGSLYENLVTAQNQVAQLESENADLRRQLQENVTVNVQ
jgi:hypothetical protein